MRIFARIAEPDPRLRRPSRALGGEVFVDQRRYLRLIVAIGFGQEHHWDAGGGESFVESDFHIGMFGSPRSIISGSHPDHGENIQ